MKAMRGNKFKSEIGNHYSNLAVLSEFGKTPCGATLWNCKCECGRLLVVRGKYLRSSHTKSCGCIKGIKKTIHGHDTKKNGASRTYKSWQGMKERCCKANNPAFANYGGRGIKVCDRWLDSFLNFLNDMGVCPPNKSIDRINNDGDYKPDNCRWATAKEQANNRRPRRRKP